MMRLSACIEWLFADETDDVAERIRLAKTAGLDAVEFWRWSNKDIDAIARALEETGMKLGAMVAEPLGGMTDPANHAAILAGLRDTVAVARRLGADVLIAQAGNEIEGVPRAAQHDAIVTCLSAMANDLAGTGIRLGIEPLNTLVDHKGYFLSSTTEALDIVDAVGRPEIGVVYDLYHSAIMGESSAAVLAGRVAHVVHLHVADHPGRNEPGSGGIDLAERLAWIFAEGYAGRVGLEYRPTRPTAEGLVKVRAALGG
jgi:hydroxypyruvate isomerase